ncbi:MAG: DAK2 domain-containing protein [Actinomycetota bacterium]
MNRTNAPTETFTGTVIAYAEALGTYEEEINGLNVYPVPDGDTGTNLRLTLQSVRKELEGSRDPCASVVRGSLMGARGNSGVILSQIFRGVAETVGEARGLDSDSLAKGLRKGTDLAYRAVMQPQEGTILTVVREAAEEAEAAHAEGEDLVEAVRRVVGRSQDALDRTPELLPILKQAGVVDAGGRGLLLFLECLLHELDGSALPPPQAPARSPAEAVHGVVEGAPAMTEEGSLEFPFEVQFLFEVPDDAADEYRALLGGYGDCVLVVGGAGLYNVHVHTGNVGGVIEEAIERGRPRQIEVTHLQAQIAEQQHEAAVLAHMQEAQTEAETPIDRLGIVAVAAGSGILDIFRSMGVRGLVPGGQTFNPSAEEILVGIRQARAEEVVVLPNNRNVVASARTAAEVAVDEGIAKRVEVVPTESPLQGFTALVAFDRDASLDANVEAMTSEGLATKHGEVAYAVRTTETPVGHVEQGQCLGLAGGGVKVVADDAEDAVIGVLEATLEETDSLVTLVYGADVDEWSAHALGKRVGERFGVEVEVHGGGQPHYPFLIGVE